jgi:hypothetical protein
MRARKSDGNVRLNRGRAADHWSLRPRAPSPSTRMTVLGNPLSDGLQNRLQALVVGEGLPVHDSPPFRLETTPFLACLAMPQAVMSHSEPCYDYAHSRCGRSTFAARSIRSANIS